MKRIIGVLLFERFELLDVFGPLEMFGMLEEDFAIRLVSEQAVLVDSAQGPRSEVDDFCVDHHPYDILLVPGGMGTCREVENWVLLDWLVRAADRA